jgi:tripartite-type tricarboxylate transporter receptor subunit TctC
MSGRSAFLYLVSIAVGGLLPFPAATYAQGYPSQPIRIIAPTAAGGVADIAARIFAHRLTEIGKTAIVENRPGGGGAIAADFVAKSAPDGYTVYVGFHATQAILPHLRKLPYDAERDFAPITIALRTTNILVVHRAIPAASLHEFIAHAKANPGKLTFASQGNGSSGHILGEQLRRSAGIDIVHVPYRGAPPAVQDLLAGHVSMMFDVLTFALPHVRAERVRSLAVASAHRDPLFPDVPTTTELGLPQLEGGAWFGFFVPARTPRPIVDWLYAEAKRAFSTAENRERLSKQGLTTLLGTPDETAAFVSAESMRWGGTIRRANIRMQ